MVVLAGFALLAGMVTVLAPCILPVLPIILAGGAQRGRLRPLGIIVGVVVAFSVFTLTLSLLVQHLGISPNISRTLGILLLLILGIFMLIPGLFDQFEAWVSAHIGSAKGANGTGFFGGVILGFSLGAVWTPCAGPILASVTTLALTNSLSLQSVVITIFYALGAAIPMGIIASFGQTAFTRLRWWQQHALRIQQTFGVVLLVTALLMITNTDRKIQTFLVTHTSGWITNLQDFEKNAPLLNNTNQSPATNTDSANGLPDYGAAPELAGITGWINSTPLKLADLRGHVVLIKFWTYSCINCIRTLPYVQAWYDKYHDQGLDVIAVHTPEFEFEKVQTNVAQAVKDFKITYPVPLDSRYGTWTAYNNQYWPAEYFIDANGHIRYTHFGEGGYDESEQVIRELLREAGKTVDGQLLNTPSDLYDPAITPETYFGTARADHLQSPQKITDGTTETFVAPTKLDRDHWALSGSWTIGPEYLVANTGAQLSFSFRSKEMYLVMSPHGSEAQQVSIALDGVPTTNNVPDDIATSSLFHIATSDGKPHTVTVTFPQGGVQLYSATFGSFDAPGVACTKNGLCSVLPAQ